MIRFYIFSVGEGLKKRIGVKQKKETRAHDCDCPVSFPVQPLSSILPLLNVIILICKIGISLYGCFEDSFVYVK